MKPQQAPRSSNIDAFEQTGAPVRRGVRHTQGNIMKTGTVKFYNTQKGYGFIQPDEGGKDVFVHASALERAGMQPLAEGQKVAFTTEQDARSGKLAVAAIQEAWDTAWAWQRSTGRQIAMVDRPAGAPWAGPIVPLDRAIVEGEPKLEAGSCRACGACCSYSREWPRFSTESDEELALIPADHIDERLNAMRCDGDRCSALRGEVGIATGCAVYSVRPHVCRACTIGDDACRMARRHFGLRWTTRALTC
jgi:uncharacterized protein